MKDPMEVLFQYAQEHMFRNLLHQEQGYDSAYKCVQRKRDALLPLLTQEAQERFEDLQEEQNLLDSFFHRAAFRAAFQLAAKLLR